MGEKKLLDILDDHRKASDEALAAAVNRQMAALGKGVKLPLLESSLTQWSATTRYLQATDPYLQPARQPYPDYLHPFTWRAP